MAVKKPWDKYEIALLIKAFWLVEEGKLDKKTAIADLSALLRKRAELQGISIDPLFRNKAGIELQYSAVEKLFFPNRWGASAGATFAEIVTMYRFNREEYNAILAEAQSQLQEDTIPLWAKKETRKEQFIAWLEFKGIKNPHPDIIVFAFDQISQFAEYNRILKCSIWELPDYAALVKLHQRLTGDHLFKRRLTDASKTFEKTWKLYGQMIADLEALQDSLKADEEEKTIEEPKAETQTFAHKVIFEEYQSVAFTTPVSVEVLGKSNVTVQTWREVLVFVCKTIVEKNPLKADSLINDTWHLLTKNPQVLKSPLHILGSVYTEGNLSADSIIHRIAKICEKFSVPMAAVAIYYRRNNGEETTFAPYISEQMQQTERQDIATVASVETREKIDSLEEFCQWLVDHCNLSESDALVKVTQLKAINTIMASKKVIAQPLWEIVDLAELFSALSAIQKTKEYAEIYRSRYEGVLKMYLEFRTPRDDNQMCVEATSHESKYLSDDELKVKYPNLYSRMHIIAGVYCEPCGVSVERILALLGKSFSEKEVVEFLSLVKWATKIESGRYVFGVPSSETDEQDAPVVTEEPSPSTAALSFDREKYLSVLSERYQYGMRFDSIDFENFRETYEELFNVPLTIPDEELETNLKTCGIYYDGMLFIAESILDSKTHDKLFAYIMQQFSSGKQILYYKAIMSDMSEEFSNCFNLTGEEMLRAYLEHTAEEDYYFFERYMSIECDALCDAAQELEDFMLSAGKPVTYEGIYSGLSHIDKEVIYRELRKAKYIQNAHECYFHINLFDFSQSDIDGITEILNEEISQNEYAIWSNVWKHIKDNMVLFAEKNPYLSSLGIRNALAQKISDLFCFSGNVICAPSKNLTMYDVYWLWAKKRAPFTDDELHAFSEEIDTVIYFDAVAQGAVRVSRKQFVAKDQIAFDVDAIDAAIATFLSSGYVLMKDMDSFLAFPTVGFEWNSFLLESYLLHYSKKYRLVNNGSALKNVAGAIVLSGDKGMDFFTVCVHELANSGLELKKSIALDHLANVNLITRRSYKDIELAIEKARQMRNFRG